MVISSCWINNRSTETTKQQYRYNHMMTKQKRRGRSSSIFLMLGLAFLAIGIATDQTAFTWIAIGFVLISLISGGKWLRPRK